MDATGYKIRMLSALDKDWKNTLNKEESEVNKVCERGLSETLKVYKDVRNTKNIDLILDMESLTLEQEKGTHALRDPSSRSSLEAAITSFDIDIKKSVEVVKNPEIYQAAAATHNSKRMYHGVPKDAFHEAVNGHITRLGNQIRTVALSISEKNILRARQENMRVAKGLYVELQQKALGVEGPEKAKGLQM